MVRSENAIIRDVLEAKLDLLIVEFSKFNVNLEKILERLLPVNDKKEQLKKMDKTPSR